MRVSVVFLLVAVTSLAGCAGDDPGPSDGDGGDMTDTNTETGNQTGTQTTEPEPEPEPRDPPEKTEFTFGPGLGCEGAFTGAGSCASFLAGPDAEPVDGVWVAVDETYWELRFTTTVDTQSGDTDCYLVAGDGTTIKGDANKGAEACAGKLPKNTGYIFLYSYVEPYQTMTLTFKV